MKNEFVNISLSKALKLKNRLAGRLSKTTSTIQTYNSQYQGRADVDVFSLDKLRGELVQSLIALKTEIFRANSGIHKLIVELGEKKSEIEFLNSLNTRDGAEPSYNNQNIVYVAAITKAVVDKRVKQLEKEIDAVQDEIDVYNAQPNRVNVTPRLIELAS